MVFCQQAFILCRVYAVSDVNTGFQEMIATYCVYTPVCPVVWVWSILRVFKHYVYNLCPFYLLITIFFCFSAYSDLQSFYFHTDLGSLMSCPQLLPFFLQNSCKQLRGQPASVKVWLLSSMLKSSLIYQVTYSQTSYSHLQFLPG